MGSFLIDTNAISDYLGNRLPSKGSIFMNEILDNQPVISIINKIELLGNNRPELPLFSLFVENCKIIELTHEIVKKTISIRKSRNIKLPDAITAATSIAHNLTLITHNLSDFQNINDIKLLDLHTL